MNWTIAIDHLIIQKSLANPYSFNSKSEMGAWRAFSWCKGHIPSTFLYKIRYYGEYCDSMKKELRWLHELLWKLLWKTYEAHKHLRKYEYNIDYFCFNVLQLSWSNNWFIFIFVRSSGHLALFIFAEEQGCMHDFDRTGNTEHLWR